MSTDASESWQRASKVARTTRTSRKRYSRNTGDGAAERWTTDGRDGTGSDGRTEDGPRRVYSRRNLRRPTNNDSTAERSFMTIGNVPPEIHCALACARARSCYNVYAGTRDGRRIMKSLSVLRLLF